MAFRSLQKRISKPARPFRDTLNAAGLVCLSSIHLSNLANGEMRWPWHEYRARSDLHAIFASMLGYFPVIVLLLFPEALSPNKGRLGDLRRFCAVILSIRCLATAGMNGSWLERRSAPSTTPTKCPSTGVRGRSLDKSWTTRWIGIHVILYIILILLASPTGFEPVLPP